MSLAIAMPWQKPAHAAEMSNAAAWSVPSSWAIGGGDRRRLQQVGDGGDEDAVDLAGRRCRRARAPSREAATDIICTVSSGVAQRRCLMPERCWIHSSLESIASTISELGTTRRGR